MGFRPSNDNPSNKGRQDPVVRFNEAGQSRGVGLRLGMAEEGKTGISES